MYQGRSVDHQIGPVLLILTPPDQLWVQVAIAALIGQTDRALVLLAQDGLVLRRGDVHPVGVRMGNGLNGLVGWFIFLFGHDEYSKSLHSIERCGSR